MRGATVGLIAALALTGCKSTDQQKDDKAPAGIAGRLKGTPVKDKDKDKDAKPAGGTGVPWWDEGKLPGAGTGVAKSNPAAPNAKADAQDALGGRVLDPLGRPARNVFVRIEPVGSSGAPIGISTNSEGYFVTRGLKPGQAYDLTAEATLDGKPLVGVVQTKVPNPILLIVLRDDLPSPSGAAPAPAPKPSDGAFPPAPQPSDATAPRPPAPKPSDGAWSPGGTISGIPPATIGGGTPAPKPPAASGALPPPADLVPSPAPSKPENVAEAPGFKPPALNVPGGPAVPPLPALPPSFAPPGGGRSSMNGTGLTTGSNAGKVALVDALEKPWELSSAAPGSLVLLTFVTSECEHSRAAMPVLREVQSRYGASGLQVAAVLCDDRPQKDRAALAARYARDLNLNFATYVEPGDAAGGVRDRFGVEQYPTSYLLTPAGKVLWGGHPGERAQVDAAVRQSLGK